MAAGQTNSISSGDQGLGGNYSKDHLLPTDQGDRTGLGGDRLGGDRQGGGTRVGGQK